MALADIAAITTIFTPIVIAIIWLARLQWKTNQVYNNLNYMREDYKEFEKRLREAEMKVYAYNLVASILDKIGDKK